MNALATIFRLLSLLSVAGLAAFLWVLSETKKKQKEELLDEQVRNGYIILQSEKEAQWKDISAKRSAFNEVFDDNQPVGLNDENPLAEALSNLRTSEDAILRNPDYRDALEAHTKEFGASTFIWDSEIKKWKLNPSVKAESIASLKDPFLDEKLFPKEDVKKEDGSVIPGVSRDNRLRTLLGMFYKDRHEKFSEIGKLRAMIVERDEALRESQNLFDNMKEQKEDWERKSGEFEVKLGQVEADLTVEKAERKSEKEASDQQILVLNNNIAGLEQQKLDNEKKHISEIDSMKEEHGEKIKALGKEITLADQAGYKRGIDEMMAKQTGGDKVSEETALATNPFDTKEEGPPMVPDGVVEEITGISQMNEFGVTSTIARIDSRSGMLMLPIGSDRGMTAGEIFTLWKGTREAARIKVQSTDKGFALAYILPRFGEPNRLRPGDLIQIVPEKKKTL
ncbi:MAG: hypothetical protein ACJZ64_04115 [Opitutales bacterium]|jgi:hypothetical protein|tara:strand:+ start:2735 stop:4090 length:1356 start_codon:yes stop_codon:yes gene_type:complete